jgi:prepilin-type N-terminal cleavage/methylation domain-containing protein
MKRKKGFSLLEVLIVIFIIGVMTVVAMASILPSRNKKDVENAAREVAAAIREAQNNALNGKQPDAANIACGHGIYIENSTDYKLFYNAKAGDDCLATGKDYDSIASTAYATYTLKRGVTFVLSGSSVYFALPFGSVYPSGTEYISIAVQKGSYAYNVCVYPSGNVEEKKPGDPC